MAKTTTKSSRKTASRSTAKQTSAAKATKKAAAKKSAVKKSTAKKTTATKAVSKKTAAKSAAAKTAAKKAAKKSTAKPAAKKSAATTAPKAAAAKPAAKKTTTKKTAASEDAGQRRAYGMYDGILVCENPRLMPRETPYSEKDVSALRRLLSTERDRLRDILRDLENLTFPGSEGNGNSGVPGDTVDNASDYMDTETSLLLRRDEEEALLQIEAAIERLENGLYGVCMACGTKIGMARLRAKPDAHLCMKCKQTYDREAARR